MNKQDDVSAEVVKDAGYDFVKDMKTPVYSYPPNVIPVIKVAPRKIETSFLTAARKGNGR